MATEEITAANWVPQPTLPGGVYWKPEAWEHEKENLFYDHWVCVGREETIPTPGDYMVEQVGDESLIITRNKEGVLRAYYNTCAHRGTKLCDDGEGQHAKSGVFKCPYHAWTFDLDGNCVGTPNVHEEEGFDKSTRPLWGIDVDSWQGFVFVHMGEKHESLYEFLKNDPWDTLQFERYDMGELRIGFRMVYEVRANWKIIADNYNECLHCPSVHPELISKIPLYRKGLVEERQGWYGNSLAPGATTLTLTGQSERPALPGTTEEDRHTYYGYYQFPNLFLNFHSDCVMYYRGIPRGPLHTTVVSDFLFRPETIAAAGFDPSDIFDFWDLVSHQDWKICEREQLGVKSRAYARGGIYPWNDHLIADFNNRYREVVGEAGK